MGISTMRGQCFSRVSTRTRRTHSCCSLGPIWSVSWATSTRTPPTFSYRRSPSRRRRARRRLRSSRPSDKTSRCWDTSWQAAATGTRASSFSGSRRVRGATRSSPAKSASAARATSSASSSGPSAARSATSAPSPAGSPAATKKTASSAATSSAGTFPRSALASPTSSSAPAPPPPPKLLPPSRPPPPNGCGSPPRCRGRCPTATTTWCTPGARGTTRRSSSGWGSCPQTWRRRAR
mmetsp:Transcript_14529/g.37096  ORF Transcript_14529/g.37096 Transcript_14529/m.37096 type:complete len:236 (-) Transcript_14529:1042-1749(-)